MDNPADDPDRWWAVIGPTPRTIASTIDITPHSKTLRLAAPLVIGDLTLRPGGALLVEYQRDEPGNLAGYVEHESWPMYVEGTTPASVELQHDSATAARAVRASVLVSLQWDEPWVVRDAPFRTAETAPQIPESWPSPRESEDEPMATAGIDPDPTAFPPTSLPASLDRAWGLFEEDAVRWSAMSWHEGLSMQHRHPSFAAVAYVSAIEALSYGGWAEREFGFVAETGSRRRVKSMLESVIEGPGASKAIKNVLEIRNKTAHAGRLFAFEASYGASSVLRLNLLQADGTIRPSISHDPDDEVQDFLWTLRLLRSASHLLLSRSLMLVT